MEHHTPIKHSIRRSIFCMHMIYLSDRNTYSLRNVSSKNGKKTSTNSGAGTVYSSGAPEFTPSFQWGSCCSIISFLFSVLQIVVCPFGLFLLAIALSILQFTTFNFSFGIFKLFLPIVLYLITYKVKVKCFIACYHLLVLLI